jgi:AcrR family transcriptional regulator
MEEKKACKRMAIMKAALELIAENGFHGAPTAMIAERAGVAIGSIYRYFENKDALIIALNSEIECAALKKITEGYDPGRPLRERYFHVAKGMLQYMVSHPLEFRFAEQFFDSPYGVALRRGRLFANNTVTDCKTNLMRSLYGDGRAQQIIKSFELAIFFSLGFGSLFNIARDHILGFIQLDEEKIDVIVGACWDAIKL